MELLSDVNGDIGEKDAERETGTGSDPLAELAWGCDPVNGDPELLLLSTKSPKSSSSLLVGTDVAVAVAVMLVFSCWAIEKLMLLLLLLLKFVDAALACESIGAMFATPEIGGLEVVVPGAVAKSPIRRSEFLTPDDDPELALELALAAFDVGAPAALFSKKDKSLSERPAIFREYRCMQKKKKKSLIKGWR